MNNKFCLSFSVSFFAFAFSFAQTTVTVEEVVQMALQKNYDIQVARATAATQFTDKRFIYGGFLPTLNATATHLQNNNNSETKYFPSANRADQNAYNIPSKNDNASVQLAWT